MVLGYNQFCFIVRKSIGYNDICLLLCNIIPEVRFACLHTKTNEKLPFRKIRLISKRTKLCHLTNINTAEKGEREYSPGVGKKSDQMRLAVFNRFVNLEHIEACCVTASEQCLHLKTTPSTGAWLMKTTFS